MTDSANSTTGPIKGSDSLIQNIKESDPLILKDLQIAAAVAAISIIGFFAVYWGVQIADVREMLALAYG